jgi:MinD superfamily P-loop ATPase
MKKLLVLSGKGGTGKTTVTAAFVSLEKALAFADCDVDAPNLHLVMQGLPMPEVSDYHGMGKAVVDTARCISCGLCIEKCRFEAISQAEDGTARVDPFSCEGCGLCEAICPVSAIEMKDDIAGDLMLYRIQATQNNAAIFSTAELKMGSGTSGKLVSEVKKQLFSEASEEAELALIDGSPGIGCPVIASISGVDFVLIVAEPSVSGISDMKRIIETAQFFEVGIAVCVNKDDTNVERTKEIEIFCEENNLPFVGRIPYDEKVTQVTNEGKTVDCSDSPAGKAIREVFLQVKNLLPEKGEK